MAVGRHVAVVGPSGSGKTTLLHILAGIVEPSAGRVVVAGMDLTGASGNARARYRQRKVAMVFQFGELLPELTVAENVALPLRIRGDRCPDGRVERVLAAVGFSELNACPARLSGGETQRVAVARALVSQPQVILCDEPTGSLDAANSRLVIDLITRSATATGATLVVVTHDDSVARRMDEVLVLHDGRLMPEAESRGIMRSRAPMPELHDGRLVPEAESPPNTGWEMPVLVLHDGRSAPGAGP